MVIHAGKGGGEALCVSFGVTEREVAVVSLSHERVLLTPHTRLYHPKQGTRN